MSDRLKELLRQRALAQEQLAWLDREIAAAQSNRTPSTEAVPLSVSRPSLNQNVTPVPVSRDQAQIDATAEELLAQYKKEGVSLEQSVKRGCFVYFFAAIALLGVGLITLYFLRTKR